MLRGQFWSVRVPRDTRNMMGGARDVAGVTGTLRVSRGTRTVQNTQTLLCNGTLDHLRVAQHHTKYRREQRSSMAEFLLLCLGFGTVSLVALQPAAECAVLAPAATACAVLARCWAHTHLPTLPRARFPPTAQPLRLRGGTPANLDQELGELGRRGREARSIVGKDKSGGASHGAQPATESACGSDRHALHDWLPHQVDRMVLESGLAPQWARRHESYDAILHVDAARGDDDSGDGSSAAPFASIFTALSRAVTTHKIASVVLAPGSLFCGHRYVAAVLPPLCAPASDPSMSNFPALPPCLFACLSVRTRATV